MLILKKLETAWASLLHEKVHLNKTKGVSALQKGFNLHRLDSNQTGFKPHQACPHWYKMRLGVKHMVEYFSYKYKYTVFADVGNLFRMNFYHSSLPISRCKSSDKITISRLSVLFFPQLCIILTYVLLWINFSASHSFRRPFYVAQSERVVTQHANWKEGGIK